MEPTLPGFIAFVRNFMRISAAIIPDDSPYLNWALQQSLGLVNRALQAARGTPPNVWTIYTRAVYNLAGHLLVESTPDVDDAPDVEGSEPPLPYLANLRGTLDMAGFISGVIQSTNDQGTGNSMVVPEQMANLTFSDLQTMKTPWGRTYLGIAQMYGQTAWGVS